MVNNLTEKEIARIWQHQWLKRDGLATVDFQRVRIIYPGQLNDDRGADFRDAVIVSGQRLIRGDVELHVRSSQWQEHGHHLDPVYNRVILHVVMWHDVGLPIRLQSGREVPTLALSKYMSTPLRGWPDSATLLDASGLTCVQAVRCLETSAAGDLLDKAGDQRFLVKAGRFRQDMAGVWGSQALYQGVMGALGYSRNKLPFLEIAQRLPLSLLESVTPNNLPDADWLARRQALFLGTAGLLSSRPGSSHCQRLDDRWLGELWEIWAALPHPEALSPAVWHVVRVRPSNSPSLRLLAMSYLLLRYRENGWLDGLLNLVKQAPLSQDCQKSLEAGLVVTLDDFPAGCPDPVGGRKSRLTLLGSQRAADIIVNVLLPFALAWSQCTAEPDLGDKALTLYHLYPRLFVNSAEKKMIDRLGLSTSLVNSARRQQGLIHIYHCFCESGRCTECPLR